MHTRPVWVEISRSKLIANYRELRRLAGSDVDVLAVMKANAYGHGMRDCAPLLVEAGAEWIGVTSVEEAVETRAVCPQANILVMSGVWKNEAEAAVERRLTPVVWEDFHLDLLEAAARQLALPPRSVRVHLEIDTGMSRQGVRLDGSSLEQMLDRFQLNSPLLLEGVATHFSAPEVIDDNATMKQLHRFEAAIELVTAKGLQPRWIHAGNSANELRGEPLLQLKRAAAQAGARFMWRPGLALYGYAPRFTNHGEAVNLAALPPATLDPVLSWKTRVTSIRTIEAGEAAGYNSTFRAAQRSHLALAPMGYADGFPRLLSNRGHMLVNGHRAPVAGRVSMDQTILDVTGLPHVSVGDEVVVIGSQGDESISASDIADLTGTIPYEVLCGIAARVPRILVD